MNEMMMESIDTYEWKAPSAQSRDANEKQTSVVLAHSADRNFRW